ncbi:DUF721 domain-containing protein [Sediminicoccus sp. KRV36]|uniref:DUF721 domain-containing protein n=1 Tax=Sediminicoccus sp. KRV36 TaxID=3133721 RepID=UPI00200FFBE0|nr:DUF721 domain-containing protein [Sediminicoccus rosea]UPY35820.1 DUF721 domain-containing protein [Sediminicoccus rosea]
MAKPETPAPFLSRSVFAGPQELGALIPRATRPAFRKRSPDAAQILADWPQIIGPEIARMAEPVRLSAGTLTLACSGPAAMELGMGAPALMQRINSHLGRIVVRKLAFIQRLPRAVEMRPKRPAPGPLPPRVAQSLDSVPGEELRLALERLAKGVFAGKP